MFIEEFSVSPKLFSSGEKKIKDSVVVIQNIIKDKYPIPYFPIPYLQPQFGVRSAVELKLGKPKIGVKFRWRD